jgi:hypothetical protein
MRQPNEDECECAERVECGRVQNVAFGGIRTCNMKASLMHRSFLILFASGVGACAADPPLLARVSGDGDACAVHVNGLTISQSQRNDANLRALATIPGRRMIVDADRRTPYRCIGGTIFNLQRAGFHILTVRVDGVELGRK